MKEERIVAYILYLYSTVVYIRIYSRKNLTKAISCILSLLLVQ